ncbi:class I SAM-dependent methyltransferase [Clostridium botulinum]|uniref:class I SAM-dependent methyltransferase n=1 Tax=Clostridium botulinum TaxID=1491 RepID=UPI000774DF3F|nr:class I SAM-dependent methyltransferase [Clostridium botulinum]
MNKLKIIIFGVGSGYERLKCDMNFDKVEMLAFVDNDIKKQGTIFNNINIVSPKEIHKYSYDYIIIASQYYLEIEKQLLDMGIEKKRIISYYYKPNDINYDIKYNKHIFKLFFKEDMGEKNKRQLLPIAEDGKKMYNKNYKEKEDKWSCTDLNYTKSIIQELFKEMKRLGIEIENCSNILDVGCAKGYFTEAFRNFGLNSYGIDYSDVAVNMAKDSFPSCTFQVMDGFNPRLNEEFDLVFVRGFTGCNTHNLNFVSEFLNKYIKKIKIGGSLVVAFSSDFSGYEKSGETVNWSFDEINKLSNMLNLKFLDIIYPEEKLVKLKTINQDKKYFYLVYIKNITD